MSRIPEDALNTVQITGPFWSAEVEVLKVTDGQDWAFRTLFLDNTPRPFRGQSEVFLPGTLLVLCFARRVVVHPNGTPDSGTRYVWQRSQAEAAPTNLTPDALQADLGSGTLALLVVQADATAWPERADTDAFFPTSLTCLAGEISLQALAEQAGAIAQLYQALPIDRAAAALQGRHPAPDPNQPQVTRLLGEITVHSSGLSLYGQTRFPWQPPEATPVHAPFLLTQDLDRTEAGAVIAGGFRLRAEKDRLVETEAAGWITAWNQLSRYLNPAHPLNQSPQPVSPSQRPPQWMTLEMTAPNDVPDLFWLTAIWGDTAQLQFAPDEFSLIVSDRPPYDGQNPPTSIARIAPTQVAIASVPSGLQLTLETTKPDAAAQTPAGQLGYRYQTGATVEDTQENFTTTDLKTAFSPVAVPRFVRNTQGLPEPEWTQASDPAPQQVIDPPVVWGLMPLENGWAQLPVPNLTEQIYLDSTLENPLQSAPSALLQGAIALGNEAVLGNYSAEQPWNLTWVDGDRLSGTWNLREENGGYRLSQIDLTVANPIITLNGFFWLSTGTPRLEDALPDLDNWVTGLQSFPLKTARPDQDLFPAPVLMTVQELTVAVRDPGTLQPSAELGTWQMTYAVDDRVVNWTAEAAVSAASQAQAIAATVFNRMIQQGVLPSDTFSAQRPFIWQRHDRLPMVQALPLTQSQTPPNYPSASRQLVPFELAVATAGDVSIPNQWTFAAPNAATWLRLSDGVATAPAAEWQDHFDLPLAALSLPGVILDPLADLQSLGLAPDPLGLTPNYRFDLPYTDEINAFAQLPSPEVDPNAVSPVPDSPPPEPPQPLTRETFSEHWQTLSELASLASADGVTAWGHLRVYRAGAPETFLFSVDVVALNTLLAAGPVSEPLQRVFATQGLSLSAGATLQTAGSDWELTDGETRYRLQLGQGIQHLIEPFDWPVQPDFQLTDYPGTLALQNGSAVSLTGEAALAGISGQFVEAAGRLSRLPTAETSVETPAYTVTAGSMAAQLEAKGLRDQRGLVRGWPQGTERWLQTPVSFQAVADGEVPYALTTARESLPLLVDGQSSWALWFRDLPLQLASAAAPGTGHFRRRDRRSPLAQDVNDPEARSREHDFLAGYEWRLGEATQTQDSLSLFNLHFYPLTLETVVLQGGDLQQVEIIGRLQLPIAGGRELTELSNAVQLTFTAGADESTATAGLTLTAIALVSEQGEWPLALKDGEASDAPLLTWQGVQLTTTRDGLALQSPQLKFVLFDHIWTVPLTTLHPTAAPDANPAWVFTSTGLPQTKVYAIPTTDSAYLRPDCLSLTLDPVELQHQAHLGLQVQLGNLPHSADRMALGERTPFAAQVQFPLLSPTGDNAPRWVNATLFEALTLNTATIDAASALVTSNTALQFRWQHAPTSDLQLLPGIKLRSRPDQSETETPGFAALTFELQPVANGVPTLILTSAFLETLLFCQWGQFLQTDAAQTDGAPSAEGQTGQLAQVFGASSGDLVCAYTTTWQDSDDTWPETLLLNGVLEIKNLISWPQALSVQTTDATTQLQLPRLPVAEGARSLPHLRHSLRILLNQHSLPTDLLTVGQGNLLFQLQPNALWQFLAVVEHQLVAVDFSGEGDALQIELQRDRRWSVTQEVRWVTPGQFKTSLESWAAIASLDPAAGIAPGGAGYFDPALNQALLAEVEALRQQPMMFVEASTHQWLNQDPLTTLSPATLQFLPNGSQLGIISSPTNYRPSDPTDPRWLLLTLPFLGRLQAIETLPLTSEASNVPSSGVSSVGLLSSDSPSPLQVDPVLHLAQSPSPSPLALMLATWQPASPSDEPFIQLPISGFETATGRTWARLDPLSLEESWFRLQNPAPESDPTQFQSVMATLQDSPARLSRAQALNQNFDSFRQTVPPSPVTDPGEPGLVNQLIWQPQSLLKTQALPAPEGLLVLYQFQGGAGNIVADVSGVGDPIDLEILNLSGDFQEEDDDDDRDDDDRDDGDPNGGDRDDRPDHGEATDPHWRWEADGLRLVRPAILISRQPPTKILRACQATNALTIEAWIEPTYDEEYPLRGGPFPIVSFGRLSRANFRLEQGTGRLRGTEPPNFYVAKVRTSQTNRRGNQYLDDEVPGEPFIRTANGSLTSRLSHVVYTRTPQGETRLYLNGELLGTRPVTGDFSTWETELSLVLGNEVRRSDNQRPTESRKPWFGKYYRVAIYNQALSAGQVSQNFAQGYTGLLRANPYPWGHTGVQLATSRLTQDTAPTLNRYAAATLLPIAPQTAAANPQPQSFALSPYLGLGFQPAGLTYQRQVVSAELLCLDPATRSLRPIASHLWEGLTESDAASENLMTTWAKETHLRLCPESPLAVLRFREIRRLSASEAAAETAAPVITTYTYGIVADLQAAELPLKRVFRLRSRVEQLRFQEGHFGGSQLPPLKETSAQEAALNLFELAAPQTIGTQPLYLTQRPQGESWPSGLSALRVSVQNTGQKHGVVGPLTNSSQTRTLWWQAAQYTVQYRPATASARPAAGLPAQFRAPAIASLLPVALHPPLPEINGAALFQQADPVDRWQAILPGTLRYLMVGDRPGVFFNLRNQLLRQGSLATDGSSRGSVFVSGSVPVQHRMPRPVPLPANQSSEQALQPWVSYFEPTRNALATDAPADEAFFGADPTSQPPTPARRLTMQLLSPAGGAIPDNWDGQLTFRIEGNLGSVSQVTDLSDWQITVEAIVRDMPIAYTATGPDGVYEPVDGNRREQLKRQLEQLPTGATLMVQANIQPATSTDNFSQTLSFPLRMTDSATLPLPLQPQFIHFEDPEYNRQLASPTAHKSTQVQVPNPADPNQPKLVGLKLATDRREYNPDGLLSLRYDWEEATAADEFQQISLTLKRIRAGVETALTVPALATRLENLPQAELTQFALTDLTLLRGLAANLQADDTLQLTLNLYREKPPTNTNETRDPDARVVLLVQIVAAPVQPTPEAAYGLLRHNPDGSVECVRFAWSVMPDRVEMINASDLRTEVVRRRAVFQWVDTKRVGHATTYRVQKITQTGSTAFFDDLAPAR
ncbi:MAG: hypothetical protein F6J95_025495 [Leptolyngbya sp. SIO1E4]|nr:hypothetical protein [Leptolyngbya sp. SIO1E4]